MIEIRYKKTEATYYLIVIPSGVPPTLFYKNLKLRTCACVSETEKGLARIDCEWVILNGFCNCLWGLCVCHVFTKYGKRKEERRRKKGRKED
jgi:hypothetical protein